MKRILTVTALLLLIFIPTVAFATSTPPTQRKAIVLSSLNALVPMGDYANMAMGYLKRAGYSVTYVEDSAVTLDLLENHLNDYDVIIWRTNSFNWIHTTYWYVGERISGLTLQKNVLDLATGIINARAGILGVSANFFHNHFGANSLNHVKLFMIISSDGNAIAPFLLSAGASSVMFCNGHISLQFGLIDDLTTQLVSYLASGTDVYTSVYNTVSPFNQGQQLDDNLDATYTPPFWYMGDGTVTIA